MGDSEVVMLLGVKELTGAQARAGIDLDTARLPRGGIVRASRTLELPVVLGAAAVDVRKNPESIHRSVSLTVGVGLWRCHGQGRRIARSRLCRGRGRGLRCRGSRFRGRGVLGLAQAWQLGNSAPFFAAEQVVVLVDGHFDAGVAHELAHGRDVAAFA